MSDVLVTERGATKWFRPSDYGANTGARHFDKRRVDPRDPGKYRRDYEERREKRRYPNGKPGQPGYKPRNPRVPKALPLPPKASPFVKRIPQTFGKAIDRALGDPRTSRSIRTALDRVGYANPLWRNIDNIASLIDNVWGDPWQRPIVDTSIWQLCTDCNKGPPYHVTVFHATSISQALNPPCFGHTPLCLNNQNGGDARPIGATMPNNVTKFHIAAEVRNPGVTVKYNQKMVYARPIMNPGPHIAVKPAGQWVDLAVGPMPNPNVQRAIAAEMPFMPPGGQPPAPVTAPPYQGIQFQPGRPPRPVIPGPRRPPGRGEKHNKNTGSKAAAVALFKALDGVSEAAEVVDALYDALPKSVRDKWDRKGRGLVDQAGQYGIDGAEWKIQALWYNWEKVDANQALKNLINNSLQDKVHGGLHRNLPKNTGSALDGAFQGIEKGLGEFVYL